MCVQMLTMVELPDLLLMVRQGIALVEVDRVRVANSCWQKRTAACSPSSFDWEGSELQEQRPAASATMTRAFTVRRVGPAW